MTRSVPTRRSSDLEIILFHRLAAEHMGPIVDIQVGRVQNLLKDRKVTLDLTDGARAWLGRVGYDPVYGARPLKRAVQKYLQDPLADRKSTRLNSSHECANRMPHPA